MTDPTDTIRDLIIRYIATTDPDPDVLPEDYIDGVRVLFDSNDWGRTVVADVLTADEGPDARVLVQFDPSDNVIFAAYSIDGESHTIPKELYRAPWGTAWMDHVDDGDMADPFDPMGVDR